jgi:hypothetical protein
MKRTSKAHQPQTTGMRYEHRFVMSEDLARLAMRTARTHLAPAQDDRPYQWSTTTYCDTYDLSLYRAAQGRASVQLRFREYHRIRPREVLVGPRAWVELKDDTDDTSCKVRFDVSAREVPSLLRGDAPLPDGDGFASRARELLTAGARPVVVTQYNRLAYAAPHDRMRITADHDLMYLAIPWGSHDDLSVPRPLGPLLAREHNVILEMKWIDRLPEWANELLGWLRESAPKERPSKFVVAMRYLLGQQDGGQ